MAHTIPIEMDWLGPKTDAYRLPSQRPPGTDEVRVLSEAPEAFLFDVKVELVWHKTEVNGKRVEPNLFLLMLKHEYDDNGVFVRECMPSRGDLSLDERPLCSDPKSDFFTCYAQPKVLRDTIVLDPEQPYNGTRMIESALIRLRHNMPDWCESILIGASLYDGVNRQHNFGNAGNIVLWLRDEGLKPVTARPTGAMSTARSVVFVRLKRVRWRGWEPELVGKGSTYELGPFLRSEYDVNIT